MRRNSNILENRNMRSGMALIMAIGFMVIIAGIMASMMNLTSVTTRKTEHMYFKEQAQLLARSATEFALLAISAHDRAANGFTNSSCVQTIATQFPAGTPYFQINTQIRYIGLTNVDPAGTCAANSYIATPTATGSVIAPESEGTVLLDVYVSAISANLNLSENIVYHHRTIQKP